MTGEAATSGRANAGPGLDIVDASARLTRDHLPGLDGLRGLLIVAIMAYHLGFADHMFVTVDTFFVLSGFLITGLLLERTPRDLGEMRAWWARRARRLVPAVALTTAVVVVVFSSRPGMSWDGVATMTWWENWRQALGATSYWSPGPTPMRHAWTLSIEEQFYLVWPIIVVALAVASRRVGIAARQLIGGTAAALGVASFAWAAWLAQHGTSLNRIYLGTDTRAGGLFLGCAAATMVRRPSPLSNGGPASRRLTAAGLAGFVLVAVLCVSLTITDVRTYSGGLALGAVGSVLLVVAAARPGPIERVLSLKTLQWLGVRSYGIYLWAWPTQVLVEVRWPSIGRPLVALVTFVCSFVLGDLSLRLVEMPLRSRSAWASRPTPRRLAWAGGAAMLVASIVGVALVGGSPVYQEVSAEASGQAALDDARASRHDRAGTSTVPMNTVPTNTVPTNTWLSTMAPSTVAPTTPIAPTSIAVPRPLRVMTAGDSQAFKAAFPKIPRRNLPDYIESVTVAGVLGCGILVRAPEWTMYDPARGGDVSGAYCRDTAEVAEVQALAAHPDWMVLFSGGFERPFGYKDQTGRLVPARDPLLRASIVEHLRFRIERARAQGVRTALVEWACMGEEVGNEEKAGWTRWHNAILNEVASTSAGTIVMKPNANVCIDSDPTGSPTPAKEKAWGYEVHPVDLTWLWNVQLGPELFAASVGTP